MKVLAFDTATEALSVSFADGPRRLDRYVEIERGHAERLLPLVHEVLAEAGVALTALDAIAFGRGPGGFTGVRLAASVAQGLAFGAGVGVVPVSNLAAVAQRALETNPGAATVLVVNDARMREVYWAEFAAGAITGAAGAEHVTAADAVTLPEHHSARPWVAAGRGLRVSPALAERCRAGGAAVLPDLLPRAAEILTLALPAVAAGSVLDPAQALPVYVRDRVAEASV